RVPITDLVEPGRRVGDERLAHLRGQLLVPSAGTKRNGLYEASRRAGVITRLQQLHHGADAPLHLGERRLELGPREQREQRRLVGDQTLEDVRAPGCSPQDDDCSKRVAGDVRRSELEVVAQRRQVIGVLEHAALLRRSLARAMAPTIVRNHAKGLGERNDDRVPVVMVSPGAVYQHERLTRTADFVVELYTIHT